MQEMMRNIILFSFVAFCFAYANIPKHKNHILYLMHTQDYTKGISSYQKFCKEPDFEILQKNCFHILRDLKGTGIDIPAQSGHRKEDEIGDAKYDPGELPWRSKNHPTKEPPKQKNALLDSPRKQPNTY